MKRKRAAVAVGLVVLSAGVAVIVNLVTGGYGWWAWLVFGALLAASGALVWWRETRSGSGTPSTALLTEAKKGAIVKDSPMNTVGGGGDLRMTIRATGKGSKVSESGQTVHR